MNCRKTDKNPPCRTCPGQAPQLGEIEITIITIFNDIQRHGYSKDLIQTRGMKPSAFLLECLATLDTYTKRKQKTDMENAKKGLT